MTLYYYQSREGWTVLLADGNIRTFSTEPEAKYYATTQKIATSAADAARRLAIMAQKQATAQAIISAVKTLAPATDSAADLEAEYFDAGTFSDDDLAALGISASDLAACITLLQQVNALMAGQATTPAVYRSTLNKVRRVA